MRSRAPPSAARPGSCMSRVSAQTTPPAASPLAAPANQAPVMLPALPKLPTLMVSPSEQNVHILSDSTHPSTPLGPTNLASRSDREWADGEMGQVMNGQVVNGQMPTVPGPVVPAQAQPSIAPPAPVAEHLLDFDPQKANVVPGENRTWRLMAGDITLKDFGAQRGRGLPALRVAAKELNLTQHGSPPGRRSSIGSVTVMPRRRGRGMACVVCCWIGRRSRRTTCTVNGCCAISSGSCSTSVRQEPRTLARALAVVQKYGFTKIGPIGGVAPTMLVFLGQGAGAVGVGAAPCGDRLGPSSASRWPDTLRHPRPPVRLAAHLLERNPGAQANLPVVAADSAVTRCSSGGVVGSSVAGAPRAMARMWKFDHGSQVIKCHDPNGWKVAAGTMEFANLGPSEWGRSAGRAGLSSTITSPNSCASACPPTGPATTW